MPAVDLASHYETGEDIRVGDHVACADWHGVVKFVLASQSFAEGFNPEHWSYLGRGFMIEFDKGGLVFQEEANEDLTLLKRA